MRELWEDDTDLAATMTSLGKNNVMSCSTSDGHDAHTVGMGGADIEKVRISGIDRLRQG